MRRILLVSSSTCHPSGYLDHAEREIRELFGGVRRVLFLPWALFDRDAYARKARERFRRMGYEIESAHETPDPAGAVGETEAVFIGGGNTFRLLKAIYEHDLIAPLRRRVSEGMPYAGSSAGSNVAGATIGTTNDMPIVQPPSLAALGLLPFNLNPHYVDADPASTHQRETREERIAQFLEENDVPVVALREGAMLLARDESVEVRGSTGGRLFRRGQPPLDLSTGDQLDFLLAPVSP